MPNLPSLGLCMIVKNEEKMLPDCLDSVKAIVQEILIADTGSDDRTAQIAQSYGARVIHVDWQQDFSHARNTALRHAKSDWLLLLDADERLVQEDIPALLNFIATTTLDGAHMMIHNRIGKDGGSVSVHQALRLLRNNGQYQYAGAIHEQIRRIDGQPAADYFGLLPVRIQHWGYMDDVVLEKGKRARNLPLLQNELESNPDNGFMLFNLGNEYLAIHDYQHAWEAFSRSLQHADVREAYVPHLYYRGAMCLNILHRPQQAIQLLTKGLALYPACTDMQLLMAHAFFGWGRYTLAIAGYEKALQMGAPPPSLRFTLQCESLAPLLGLARLHSRLHDPVKALEYYTRALAAENTQISILYEIGGILGAIFPEPEKAAQQLAKYFGTLDHLPNRIVYADILIRHGFYAQAEAALDMPDQPDAYPADIALLRGALCLLYQRSPGAALALLDSARQNLRMPALLADTPARISRYRFTAALLHSPDLAADTLADIAAHCPESEHAVYTMACSTYTGNQLEPPLIRDTSQALACMEELLGLLLTTQAFDAFEKLLYVYNRIDSDQVLVSLARVYHAHRLDQLAMRTLLRSLREYGTLGREAAQLLARLSAS